MGYFRRKLRRRASATIRSASAFDIPDGWVVAPAVPPSRWPRTTYLRFVVGWIDPDSHEEKGIFQAAGDVEDDAATTPDVRRQFRAAGAWFHAHLTSPKQEPPPRAVFWFKTQSDECIRHVWQLVRLLQRHHGPVYMLTTQDPGSIWYEDRWQVAAVGWRDKRARRRLAPDARESR